MVREDFKRYFESLCIPADSSFEQIAKSWGEVNNDLQQILPNKLFRYRKIRRNKEGKDFIVDSLKAKTIATCSARCFSDKYDSLCYLDENKVSDVILRLINRDTIKSCQKLALNREFPVDVIRPLKNLMMMGARQLRTMSTEEFTSFLRMRLLEKNMYQKIVGLLRKCTDDVRMDNTAQIACFTESVTSKYMWDVYADAYRGYALEYDFSGFPLIASLLALPNETTHSAILPIFYSDERYDLSSYCIESYILNRYVETQVEETKPILHNIDLLDLIRPYLYKSTEYSREHEWRLICKWGNHSEKYAYVPDFDMLKAIYYGPEISLKDKEDLHKIAVYRGLKEHNVVINQSKKTYDLDIEAF